MIGSGRHPLTRIVLAAAPIVLVIGVVHWAFGARGASGARLAASLFSATLTVAIYAGYVRLVERRLLHEFGGGVAASIRELAGGLALGVGLFASTIGVSWALGVCTVERGAGWGRFGAAFGVSLGTAVVEEVLLRGVVFRILAEWLGKWTALSISAALFGALHAFNQGATVFACVAVALEAGVLLAAAYLLRRRLWLPIALHAGWNFAGEGIFGAIVSGNPAPGFYRTTLYGPPLLTGGAFGPEASLTAVALCSVASLALLRTAKR
jgi:membrane protease YdiL (CAAX protease family)